MTYPNKSVRPPLHDLEGSCYYTFTKEYELNELSSEISLFTSRTLQGDGFAQLHLPRFEASVLVPAVANGVGRSRIGVRQTTGS